MTLPREFDLIARHFRPLAGEGALGLSDDAAVFVPPAGELVVAADAMVAGVHFLPDDPAEGVGRKLLRANLSDLAAMGAAPFGYLMTVSAPAGTPEAWFAGFAAGLAVDQAEFGVRLLGGDTTSTPGPLSLSLTVLGSVVPGRALRREGAREGDGVWVSGTVGDGALGLLAARGELADPTGFLAGRYRRPEPRLGLGARLWGVASAVMDVSDGLVQDLGHLCRAGLEAGLGAELEAEAVPLSAAARELVGRRRVGPGEVAREGPGRGGLGRGVDRAMLERCLTGGDDYELLMAVPTAREAALLAAAAEAEVGVTRVGRFGGEGVRVTLEGEAMLLARGGWSHF